VGGKTGGWTQSFLRCCPGEQIRGSILCERSNHLAGGVPCRGVGGPSTERGGVWMEVNVRWEGGGALRGGRLVQGAKGGYHCPGERFLRWRQIR